MTRCILAFLCLLTVGSALGVCYLRYVQRQQYVALVKAEHDRDALNTEFGRLQLELATLSQGDRIEQLATQHLNMTPAQANTKIVVLRR